MKHPDIPLVLAVLLALAPSAAAQAPGQVEPTSAPFLEKRVPEELATEGIVLSRRNLSLQVEQLGGKWLVSLVDLTTGRVAASTKVDQLPADREAAVAAMTHVVADLAAQVVGRAEPPPSPPAPAPAVTPDDDRAERAQREIAELTFKRRSIRFGAAYQLFATGNTVNLTRRWLVYRGDLDQELDPMDFYTEVGRPDLGESYLRRRHIMIGSFITAGVMSGLSIYFAYKGTGDCSIDLPYDQFHACQDKQLSTNLPLMLGALVGSGIAYVVGIYLVFHPHPIDENEAKSLADAYNQRLRGQLGLPVVTQRPLLRDIKLTPYLGGRGGGLALTGRF